MRRTLLSLALSLFFMNTAMAYEDTLDGLLKDHVKPITAGGIQYNGVDYDAWNKDPRHETVKKEILSTDVSSLKAKNEKLAFWINAYNFLTIDLIIREGERDTIKNLGGTFISPWKKHKWNIGGKSYTLDQIEHDTIRPLGEPQIHFAVNCAAISCPDLRNEVYRADKLDAQLKDQTNSTLNNTTKGYVKLDGNAVKITKVMDWYDNDFSNGDLNEWLGVYKPNEVNANTNIDFFDYNWSLNKK